MAECSRKVVENAKNQLSRLQLENHDYRKYVEKNHNR